MSLTSVKDIVDLHSIHTKLRRLKELCDKKQEEISPTYIHHWKSEPSKFYRKRDLPGGPSQKVLDTIRNYKPHCPECGGNDSEGHGIGCWMALRQPGLHT